MAVVDVVDVQVNARQRRSGRVWWETRVSEFVEPRGRPQVHVGATSSPRPTVANMDDVTAFLRTGRGAVCQCLSSPHNTLLQTSPPLTLPCVVACIMR